MSQTVNDLLNIFKNFLRDTSSAILGILETLFRNRLYLALLLVGALFVLEGLYVSVYKNAFLADSKKFSGFKSIRFLRFFENLVNKFPLKILSKKLDTSLSYFMLNELVTKKMVVILTLVLPMIGIVMYAALLEVISLWYTRLVTLVLCLMVPYYIFTLIVDYMKYSLKLKIPHLIDSFRSSYMTHCRIKPALLECSKNIDKSLGRIISRASDSGDLNESLSEIRDRVNDTWFNMFVLLLVNYRENGGELIAQLYKLNRTITRYNNIEKKKNKRLIWYEVFAVGASIFSLPVIIMLNKIILGVNSGMYYDSTSAFSKVVIFSLCALLVVRVLRRM